MIAHTSCLDGLIKALMTMRGVAGNAYVYVGKPDDKASEDVVAELVYIDSQGNVVGDEANDYQPKPGEFPAIRLE